MAVAEACREPGRDRPMMFDTDTYGGGGGDGGAYRSGAGRHITASGSRMSAGSAG